jgi:predicted transcriptional regulator of viral defense system
MQMNRKNRLADYIDELQTQGRYTFTRDEAFAALEVSEDAVRFAILRLLKKSRLMRPVAGFYVIIPTD